MKLREIWIRKTKLVRNQNKYDDINNMSDLKALMKKLGSQRIIKCARLA